MSTLSKQVLRVSNAIREEVDGLDAVDAGFLAIWLVLTVIAAFAVLAYCMNAWGALGRWEEALILDHMREIWAWVDGLRPDSGGLGR